MNSRIIVLNMLCLLMLLVQDTNAQQARHSFLEPADSLYKGRVWLVSGSLGGAYAAGMLALNAVWYKDYPRGKFHFHNDMDTWLQMDKVGHAWTAYAESEVAMELYRWAGLEDRKSAYVGAAIGSLFQGSIEVLDGYSEQWGASPADIVANTFGSALLLGQELAWTEQRIRLKWSFHAVDYSDLDQILQDRAEALFGKQYQQMMLKNYNGQSYWLSINPSSFMNTQTGLPKWLNIAVGYGIEDVFGGSDNIWENDDGLLFDYSHLERKREYYLSLDIDFRRIDTNSRVLKTLFGALNVFKVPAPALCYRQKEGLIFYPLYW